METGHLLALPRLSTGGKTSRLAPQITSVIDKVVSLAMTWLKGDFRLEPPLRLP
jgi:hypothetical protein